jgi:hypothetical protein
MALPNLRRPAMKGRRDGAELVRPSLNVAPIVMDYNLIGHGEGPMALRRKGEGGRSIRHGAVSLPGSRCSGLCVRW